MNSKLSALFAAASFFRAQSAHAMTLAYENNDSHAYAAEAVCSGSKQDPVKFSASTTSSVSIQGSSPCKLTLNGATYEFTGDAKTLIKDGKISGK